MIDLVTYMKGRNKNLSLLITVCFWAVLLIDRGPWNVSFDGSEATTLFSPSLSPLPLDNFESDTKHEHTFHPRNFFFYLLVFRSLGRYFDIISVRKPIITMGFGIKKATYLDPWVQFIILWIEERAKEALIFLLHFILILFWSPIHCGKKHQCDSFCLRNDSSRLSLEDQAGICVPPRLISGLFAPVLDYKRKWSSSNASNQYREWII